MSKEVSGTTDSDGSYNIGLNKNDYVPVGFVLLTPTDKTRNYFFSTYHNTQYITLLNEAMQLQKNSAFSGIVYYIAR